MKMRSLAVLLVSAAVIGSACDAAKNSNSVDHSKMDHGNMNHQAMDHSKMKSSPDAAKAPYDLQFIDTMIEHHKGAVDMARLVEAKAASGELKTLARGMITAQEKEIGEMKAWRAKWFAGQAPAINMEMAGMSDSMKDMNMNKLGPLNGDAFDLEFIKQMIPHHEGAVIMAKDALQKTEKQEIKKLAEAVIKEQDAEIKQMKDWQTAWQK